MTNFSRSAVATIILGLVAVSQQTQPEVSLESMWEPSAEVAANVRQSCSSKVPPALKTCFADAMEKGGATPQAVAFTRAHTDPMYVQEFQEAGKVDIASVTRPFRANENDGILLVNGSPSEVDVDDASLFPLQDLKADAEYASLLQKNSKAMLVAGDRSNASAIEIESSNLGQGFVVGYRIVDGCRACAQVGFVRFRFDFDPQGAFRAAKFVSFTLSTQGPEDSVRSAPAGLDMSSASKLIQKIYASTRTYKESEALQFVAEARELVKQRNDVKKLDSRKRTALHWTIFGSASAPQPRLVAAYEELAADLIDAGVEVNAEDQYQDTALDYLDYSPNHEMEILLLEHGAVSGYFTGDLQKRFVGLFERVEAGGKNGGNAKVRQEMAADLAPGMALSVRLVTPVGSERSWTGDPIEAVVTAPLMKETRLILAPGTKIEGTIFYSQTAPDRYGYPRLVLDFANVVHSDGRRSPIFVRVAEVDNARETVRNNEITGIAQPHASNKATWGMRVVSFAHPGVAWAVEGMRRAYGFTIRREIDYPAGTDLTLQVTGPSKLHVPAQWSAWKTLPPDSELEQLVTRSPARTIAKNGTPSDFTNLMFLGTRSELESAFEQAGWVNADRLTVASSLKAFQATVRKTGYDQAPVSLLTIEGAAPDYVFQKGLNTFAQRHHIRVWKQPGQYRNRDIWVSSSTHDTGIGIEGATKWFHRIDPRIDRERTKVKNDLLYSQGATSYALIDRPRVPRRSQNSTGDHLLTDGKMLVLWLNDAKTASVAR